MKKIYLLGLTSMFAFAMNAQTTLKVKSPLKNNTIATVAKTKNANTVAKNGSGNNSIQAMTGTLICNTQYVAGTTMDLNFTLELTNTDAEYGDKLDITFPADFTINSTTNMPDLGPADGAGSSDGPEAFVGIVGQTITWGNDDNSYGGIIPSYDPNGPGTYDITINVTIAPTATGNQVVNFDVSGDQFGAAPADLVGGVCTVFPVGAIIVNGQITEGGPQTITSCGNGVLPIAIRIKNLGNDSIMNFPVSYNVNNGTAVTEMINDTILAGDSLDYMFTATYDFTAEADYEVRMWTTVPNEFDPNADTLRVDLQNSIPVDLSTTNYSNGFETAGDLFALYIGQNAGSTANWTWSTTTPHSGARTLNLQAAAAIADAWVMFKCMNVTAGDNYRLTYWTRTNTGFNGGISISLGAGATTADMNAGLEIKPFVATTPGTVWRKDSVDYMAPISGTIYLGVRGQGTATGSGTMVKLDDISIFKPAPVGIKENAASQAISVFPNPNNGTFSIRAIENNSSVEVYSIIGENVYSSTLVKGNNSVDLSNLAAGSYIVKVKSGAETISKRVVINK